MLVILSFCMLDVVQVLSPFHQVDSTNKEQCVFTLNNVFLYVTHKILFQNKLKARAFEQCSVITFKK